MKIRNKILMCVTADKILKLCEEGLLIGFGLQLT